MAVSLLATTQAGRRETAREEEAAGETTMHSRRTGRQNLTSSTGIYERAGKETGLASYRNQTQL